MESFSESAYPIEFIFFSKGVRWTAWSASLQSGVVSPLRNLGYSHQILWCPRSHISRNRNWYHSRRTIEHLQWGCANNSCILSCFGQSFMTRYYMRHVCKSHSEKKMSLLSVGCRSLRVAHCTVQLWDQSYKNKQYTLGVEMLTFLCFNEEPTFHKTGRASFHDCRADDSVFRIPSTKPFNVEKNEIAPKSKTVKAKNCIKVEL